VIKFDANVTKIEVYSTPHSKKLGGVSDTR